jgi:light-regulated signal transduction histidine kinase (bacteriophytochrome)
MDRLTDGLLALARMARSEMRLAAVNLSDLAQTIALELQKANPGRDVEFLVASGLVVNADALLLRALLENLLGNAWKFTGKHARARIEVGMSQQAGEQVYFVKDDGAGFDMEYSSRMFGPFQRFHRQTEFEGTGIGLANVRRIIQRHGGRVWAEGEVEKGATFFFTF